MSEPDLNQLRDFIQADSMLSAIELSGNHTELARLCNLPTKELLTRAAIPLDEIGAALEQSEMDLLTPLARNTLQGYLAPYRGSALPASLLGAVQAEFPPLSVSRDHLEALRTRPATQAEVWLGEGIVITEVHVGAAFAEVNIQRRIQAEPAEKQGELDTYTALLAAETEPEKAAEWQKNIDDLTTAKERADRVLDYLNRTGEIATAEEIERGNL